MSGRIDFDVFVRDHATASLAKVSAAFKKVSRDADHAGKDTGDGFGKGFKRWFTGDGKGLFAQVGKDGGTVFGSGLLGVLKTPVLGPALIGTVGAAAAVAAPTIGAILAGGIVAGAGAGLAGLGVVFAAKSEVVKKEWSDTLTEMGSDMRALSQPFESVLVDMAGVAKRTFDGFKPALESSFKKMAPVLSRFGDQVGLALGKLEPAIAPLTDAFEAVLDKLGPALGTALTSVSQGMTDLANSVKQNPEALADFTTWLGNSTKGILDVVAGLNKVNEKFKEFNDFGKDTAGGILPSLGEEFGFFKDAVNPLGGLVNTVKTGLGALGDESDSAGASMNAAADQVTKNAQAMQQNSTAATGLTGSISGVNDALATQKGQFSSAIAAMQQWNNLALANSNSAIAYEQALDDANQSLKDNGKTLDIHTEKGRANRTALNQIAAAANAQTKAMDDAGASEVAIAEKAKTSHDAFVRMATQMGLSKKAAEALATQLINIPNVSREAKLTANKKDLETKLASVKKQLKDPDLTKERRAKLNADKTRLEAALRSAQAQIDALHGKTVTITYNEIRTRRTVGNFEGGVNAQGKAFASGGRAPANEVITVGERGPEQIVLDRPGTVIPNHALGGGGSASSGGIELGPRTVAALAKAYSKALEGTKMRLDTRGGQTYATLLPSGG